MHTALNYLDHEQAEYRELNARLATAPLPHIEIAHRRAQRDRFEQIATAYAAKVREAIPTLDEDLLDDYRRAAEGFGSRNIVGGLTGDELARLCDEELAGRYITVPHLDADARLRAARNEIAAGLDRLFADASVVAGAAAGIVAFGAAMQVVALFVGGVL